MKLKIIELVKNEDMSQHRYNDFMDSIAGSQIISTEIKGRTELGMREDEKPTVMAFAFITYIPAAPRLSPSNMPTGNKTPTAPAPGTQRV